MVCDQEALIFDVFSLLGESLRSGEMLLAHVTAGASPTIFTAFTVTAAATATATAAGDRIATITFFLLALAIGKTTARK